MLNPVLRDLKKALIEARGDMVRAVQSNRSPEKIQKLRGRTHAAWERLERALRERPAAAV
jgi:translation elongation factor EF-Ts